LSFQDKTLQYFETLLSWQTWLSQNFTTVARFTEHLFVFVITL
jgi:hypothetical protein